MLRDRSYFIYTKFSFFQIGICEVPYANKQLIENKYSKKEKCFIMN